MAKNPRTSLVDVDGLSVSFIHIPKTGGQSIQRGLKMGLRQHLPATNRLRRDELLSCDYAFAFIRNPYSRAVSLFYWFAQLHLKPIRRVPFNAAMNQWCRNTDINTFWQKVDIDYVNRHSPMFHSQCFYLERKDGKLHPRIKLFKFEEFSKEWDRLMVDLDCDRKLPHVNKSKHSAAREELSPETKERLVEIYRDDFDRLYPHVL